MAVAREKGDQAKENGCKDCDPALTVKSETHRSQSTRWKRYSTPELVHFRGVWGSSRRTISQWCDGRHPD